MERTKDVPGISLVVPVYNVQEYLPECLDSLLGQSFAAIEIILVDDGSTDASAEICDRYAARDGRIRVVHQQNAGVSKARNVGIRLARGKYLGFVDGDDWVDRDYCKRLYETLIDYRADISICSYYVARSRKTKPEAADGKITIYDRKEAIRKAIGMASKGDIILVAGKGHENYQEVKGVKHHFDDKEVIREIFDLSNR